MVEHSAADTALMEVFGTIANALGCETPRDAVDYLKRLDRELFSGDTVVVDMRDVLLLAGSVNVTRLKNNPVKLEEAVLVRLYKQILAGLAAL